MHEKKNCANHPKRGHEQGVKKEPAFLVVRPGLQEQRPEPGFGEERRGHRQIQRAADDDGPRPPLAEAGFTKADIRDAARALGLPNWSAPAAPCLASRVRYGLQVTPQRLREVEAGESVLRRLGVSGDLRVRHEGNVGRIEVAPEWIPWVKAREGEIAARLRDVGFESVEIDPRGYRRGSLLLAARDR